MNQRREPEVRAHAVRHDRRRAPPRRLRREPHRLADQGASREEGRDRAHAEGHVLLHAGDVRRRLPQQRGARPSSSALGAGARSHATLPGRRSRRDAAGGDGARARRHGAEGVQDPPRAHRHRIPDARCARERRRRAPRARRAGRRPRPRARAVSRGGALLRVLVPGGRGLSLRARPTAIGPTPREPPIADAERERLVTVLCNYCVGETAALEGASGLDRDRAQPPRQGLPATQVADEGRHLEVLLHRLRDLGVADPEAEVERRASRSLLLFRRRLLELVAARTGRRRSSRRTSSSSRSSSPSSTATRRTADPMTREVLQRHRQGRAAPHRLRRERARPPAARRAAHPRAPRTGASRSSTTWCSTPSRRRCTHIAMPRDERERLGRAYLESVERLGFALMIDPLASSTRRHRRDERPRQRFVLDDTGFDEVPKKYRRFYRKWRGAGRRAGAERGHLPGVQGRHPLEPRAASGRSRLLHAVHVAPGRGARTRPGRSRRASRTEEEGAARPDASAPRRCAPLSRAAGAGP